MRLPHFPPGILALLLLLTGARLSPGQTTASATGDPALDRQRDIIQGRAAFDVSLDKNSDGRIDVRDMALHVNGKPVSATFGSAETLAFYAEGLTLEIPVHFSKPVTGTVGIDLGGGAVEGAGEDFTLLYQNPEQKTFSVVNASSLAVPVRLRPWRGTGGEKIIRLTISRRPGILPENGFFSTHLLRIRQFDAGEFTGALSFAAGSGVPSLPVRLGLYASGRFELSFGGESTYFSTALTGGWTAGGQGFPGLSEALPFQISGADLDRTEPVRGTLTLTRLAAPLSPENQAYLEAFPAGDRPALYEARLALHNLFAAGNGSPNPFSVHHQGRLTLQAVHYSSTRP